MDGDPIPPMEWPPMAVARAVLYGLPSERVQELLVELAPIMEAEVSGACSDPLDARSWAMGAAYVALWLVGDEAQTPGAFLASLREAGSAR